jgi:hypothetical protein
MGSSSGARRRTPWTSKRISCFVTESLSGCCGNGFQSRRGTRPSRCTQASSREASAFPESLLAESQLRGSQGRRHKSLRSRRTLLVAVRHQPTQFHMQSNHSAHILTLPDGDVTARVIHLPQEYVRINQTPPERSGMHSMVARPVPRPEQRHVTGLPTLAKSSLTSHADQAEARPEHANHIPRSSV